MRKLSLLLVIQLFLVSFAHGAYYHQGKLVAAAPDPNVHHPPPPAPAAFSYRSPIDSTGLFLGGEFLYWKMDECGMDYAFENDKPPAVTFGNDRQSIVGDLLRVDLGWDPGVRGYVGYRFPERFWEVEGEYTFYYTQADKTTRMGTGPNDRIVGTFPEFFGGLMEMVSSHFNFHYHTARAHIARRFFVGDSIFLRFFAGPQGAWMSNKWRVTYTGEDQDLSTHRNNWEFEGGGLHLGIDSDWYIGRGFSLFFNGAVAALYGSHRVFSSIDITLNTGGPFQQFGPKDHRVAQSVQLQGGIAWGKVFSEWFVIKLFAAYELNSWYNLQEQYRVDLSGNTANVLNEKVRILTTCPINLQGLTAGFELKF